MMPRINSPARSSYCVMLLHIGRRPALDSVQSWTHYRAMCAEEIAERLRQRGIQVSAQRVEIARYVLATHSHPTAEQVYTSVRASFPYVSRATVYNTLKLFVEKGLLRHVSLGEAAGTFDANVHRHHHLVDRETGEVQDIPWDALDVRGLESLEAFDVDEYMVIVRGRRRPGRTADNAEGNAGGRENPDG